MKIYFNNTYIEIQPDDNAYRSRQIMGEDSLYLSFDYQGYLDIPVGAYCVFDSTTYYLLKPQNFKKNGTRKFSYELTMESDAGRLALYRFKNTVDGRIKFEMASRPSEYLAMIVANMNLRNSGWTAGQCIDANEKLIAFNANTIQEALDEIAKQFDTEWFVDGKVIGLGKIHKNEDNALALSYGKGNGFVPGLGRSNYDNSFAFDILYVQGGERNIDFPTYGSKTLLLPKSQTLRYDGSKFEGETGFVQSKSRQYITDAAGMTIRRNDKQLTTLAPEDCYEDSESYPKRIGKVSSWIVVDTEKNFYDFVDSSIPNDLDYNDVMIADQKMTVIFQSGMLAGREFEIQSYDHATRKFEIVPAELDGQVMPNDTFKAAVNDEYAIFGCTLPAAYICDNDTKSGAEWDMFKQAVRYMWENEDPRFTFSGVLDGRWAAENWSSISSKLVLGGTIQFSDTQFLVTPENIRIIGIKQYLNKPHYPELDLSNATVASSIATELNEYKAEPVLREASVNDAVLYTKRRWRDIKETQDMLEEAFEHFSGSIAPVTVQTMQMLVGDESLQFRFVTSKVSPAVDSNFSIAFNGTTKILTVQGGLTGGAMILQHMTLGVNTLSSSHDAAEYKFWDIAKYLSPALNDTDASYYVYAKVAKNGSTGDIVMSTTAIGMESVSGFYHLLLGILNSEYEGSRSFAPLFGYTEILPGRVTTDRVCSADGVNYFDLLTGDFLMKLADNSQFIKFSSNGVEIKGKLTIGSGSSGIENLDGYTSRQTEIDNAIAAVAGDLDDFADAMDLAIQDLQDQIDDNITTWYYEGVPTLSNAPAVDWDTADKKQQHIGDLYYDKLTGFAYRFLLDGTTYKWVQIQDEAIGQALAAAAAAQDTADGKRTIYWGSTAPTGVTLSIGDMWSNGEVLKIWNGSAWVDSNTYASQAALSGLADSFQAITDAIQSQVDEMEEAISRMNDDSVFDNSEKSYIRTLWENINGAANLTEIGAGTYRQTLQLAEDCGANTGIETKLKFNSQSLLFDNDGTKEEISFWVIGISQLEGAYYSLRDYLRKVNLYLSQDTTDFDREFLAELFTVYYKAEQALVSYSSNCYAESFCRDTLQDFIDGDYATDLAGIQEQVDEKAETWYQNTDPSSAWDTDTKKELHLGDLWYNTSPDANGNTHTYVYRKKNNAYGWEEMNGVPKDVFDMADGKASIYTAKPSSYKKNDMWILESAYTLSGVAYAAGTIVVATQDSTTWNAAHWTKKDKYTDDTALAAFLDGYSGTLTTIRNQVDQKAETWRQATDPASAWTTNDEKAKHVGDLWMDISTNGGNKTYIYQNTGTAQSPTYEWVAQEVPTLVFDQIDGKAAIYVTWNAWVVNNVSKLQVKDIFIPAADTTQGGVTYKANKLYRCTSTNPVTFEQLDYTNDAALNAFISGAYADFVEQIGTQMDAKADTFVQSSDPATAWNTTELKDLHVGDMWLNTSKSTVSGIASFKTGIYTKSGSTYSWVQQNVPNEMFDAIDGKASVYVSKPTSYNARDLWILEQAYVLNGVAYRAGTLVIATTTSQTFNAAHWVKRDAYIDSVDMDAALEDIEAEISQMKATLADINDDSIMDVTEKGYIRTLWEAINGLPTTDQIGSNGSYMKTKNIVEDMGAIYSSLVLLFNAKHLYFHPSAPSEEITFHYAGVAELDAAFYSLRSFLRDANLYSDVTKSSFDREEMARLFTDYYNAVQNVLQREVADARDQIDMFANDGYISAPEKRALVAMKEDEARVYSALVAKAQQYADDSSSATVEARDVYDAMRVYMQAYTAYLATMNYYIAQSTWEDDIAIITTSGASYSWSWITGYYEKRDLLEQAIDTAMKAAISDIDYLTEALGDGASTEMSQGVVLSNVIGVKETSTNKVVAGMNGSAAIANLYDSVKGRLMMWAGSTNGVAGAKQAKYRVWENGLLEAMSGTFWGKLMLPFTHVYQDRTLTINDGTSFIVQGVMGTATLTLPDNNVDFDGWLLFVYAPAVISKMDGDAAIAGRILCPNKVTTNQYGVATQYYASLIGMGYGSFAMFINVQGQWILVNIFGYGVTYTSYY